MLIESFTIEYGVKQDNMTVYGEPGYMPKVGIVLDLNIVYDEFPNVVIVIIHDGFPEKSMQAFPTFAK